MESKRGVSLLVVIFLPMLALAVHVIGKEPGYGYPGTLLPYRASRELKEQMAKFGLKAGRFVRNALPADYLLPNEKFALEDISYLLYTPRRVAKSVPMVVYFSGTGEQGDDLMCEFGQTTVFEKLTVEEFQKKHPCYLFAPLMPKGLTMRAARYGERSRLADLTSDAMYAVIMAQKSPAVDTNRLYVTGLSWGGVAAFELASSYPGRFAASVPISCIHTPLRIPAERPGNYWMIYNESSYQDDCSQRTIQKLEEVVRTRGGEFMVSTFPDTGHDAWRKAWSEDSVWDWMFSKGLAQRSRLDDAGLFDDYNIIGRAKCAASVPGLDEGHGPERAVDGLDGTAYVSERPVEKGDWFMLEFQRPIKGTVRFYSGYRDGKSGLCDAAIEVMIGEGKWRRAGVFSKKNGECKCVLRTRTKCIRVIYYGAKSRTMVLRKVALGGG